MAVIVAAISAGSGGMQSNTTNEQLRTNAATIIEQARLIKLGAERLVLRGNCQADGWSCHSQTITASNQQSAQSIFSPSGGGIQYPIVPPNTTEGLANSWRIGLGRVQVNLPAIRRWITTLRVTPEICAEINRQLYGTASVWQVADNANCTTGNCLMGVNDGTCVQDAPAAGDSARICLIFLPAPTGGPVTFNNQERACVRGSSTSANIYIFYQVIGVDPGQM